MTNLLASWSPEEWGKFFIYFSGFITTTIVPILVWYVGKMKGKQDAHGDQLQNLQQQQSVIALATTPKISEEAIRQSYQIFQMSPGDGSDKVFPAATAAPQSSPAPPPKTPNP